MCRECRKASLQEGSAAFFAAGHDGGVKALAETGGEFVNLVGTIDFNSFTGGVEGDFAVLTAFEVLLQLGSGVGVHRVVNQVVEEGEEFSAGHFFLPCFLRK
jgi:hypothetical protein